MTTTLPDPITNNQERVMVRNTATGFEQGVAAVAGLFTAGPIGALASWGAIRGLQGKWTPWFILGVPAAAAINVVNTVAVVSLVGAFGGFEGITDEVESLQEGYKEQSSLIQEMPEQSKEINVTNVGPSENCVYQNKNGFNTFYPCEVSQIVNANGHTIHDLTFNSGKKNRVILFADGNVEYFEYNGNRNLGTYQPHAEYDGYVTVTSNNAYVGDTDMRWTFSYKLPV